MDFIREICPFNHVTVVNKSSNIQHSSEIEVNNFLAEWLCEKDMKIIEKKD